MIPRIPINKTTITIAAFAALLIALSIQTYRANRLKGLKEQAETERDQAIDFIKDEKDKTEIFRNRYNEQVAKTEHSELSLSNIQDLLDNERLQHLRKVEGLNKKLSNLISTSTADIKINTDSIPRHVVTIPCKDDSIKAFLYSLKDEFNHIEAVVLDSPIVEITVPVETTDYWERTGRFLFFRTGPRVYFREITSPNKLAETKGQRYYTVQKKKKQTRRERTD